MWPNNKHPNPLHSLHLHFDQGAVAPHCILIGVVSVGKGYLLRFTVNIITSGDPPPRVSHLRLSDTSPGKHCVLHVNK